MLDHVEKIFADMKPMMKKLKKASYKVNMEAFIENHGHYFREMTEYTENASDKETAAKELAVDFTDKVYDAYVSPKKGKIDCFIHYLCYRLYRIISDHSFTGRKVCRSWNNRWYGRFILGTEQGTFYGRCTC